MDHFQFQDIPQISDTAMSDGQSFLFTMQEQHFSQLRNPHVVTHRMVGFPSDVMEYDDLNANGAMSMQPMQRFLRNIDPSPFASGLLHSNVDRSMQQHNQIARLYDRQWPFADYLPSPSRDGSPGRTSISGTSSHSNQNELRSPHPLHAAPYSNTFEFSQTRLSYPSPPGHTNDSAYPAAVSLPGNSINLRDLEYHHEDLEPTVEEHEHIDTKSEYEYEQDTVYVKSDPVAEKYKAYPDTTAPNNAVRDAESVQPMAGEDESDSDYKPTSSKSSKKRRTSTSSRSSARQTPKRRGRKGPTGSTSPHRKTSTTSTRSFSHRVNKRSSDTSVAHHNDIDARPFPCPLAGYGCHSNFASKNEWKRHVSTQHIKLGFWRCDLCATTVDANDENSIYHNDFNRKDLFTQHLRRMHAAPSSNYARNLREYPVTEDNLSEHQQRCYQSLRGTPQKSSCLFCDRVFAGPNSWEERMEHVGRHLEKERKFASLDSSAWNQDKGLEQWLLAEGLIEQERTGEWKIGNGKPIRRSLLDSDDDSEEDS